MSHYKSRGTLKQVKYGQEYLPPEEEFEAVFMSFKESANAMENCSPCPEISGIFGIYYNTCPYVRRTFNEKYFKPGY